MTHLFVSLLLMCFLSGNVLAQSTEILVVPKGTTTKFWKAVESGVQRASSDLSAAALWRGPIDDWDVDAQIKIVRKYLNSEIKVLVLAPGHKKRLVPIVEDYVRRGKKVVIFDSDIEWNKYSSLVATNNYEASVKIGEVVAKQLKKNSKILLVRSKKGNASTDKREAGFLHAIQSSGKDIKVAAQVYSNMLVGQAFRETVKELRNHPDVAAVFASNEPSLEGAGRAVKKENKKDIIVSGFDMNDSIYLNLKLGYIDYTVLQDPEGMGFKSVEVAKKIINNQKVDKIIFTNSMIVSRENYKNQEIKKYLEPVLKVKIE